MLHLILILNTKCLTLASGWHPLKVVLNLLIWTIRANTFSVAFTSRKSVPVMAKSGACSLMTRPKSKLRRIPQPPPSPNPRPHPKVHAMCQIFKIFWSHQMECNCLGLMIQLMKHYDKPTSLTSQGAASARPYSFIFPYSLHILGSEQQQWLCKVYFAQCAHPFLT